MNTDNIDTKAPSGLRRTLSYIKGGFFVPLILLLPLVILKEPPAATVAYHFPDSKETWLVSIISRPIPGELFILYGLIATIAITLASSIGMLIDLRARRCVDLDDELALMTVTFLIGWCFYPYWSNGLYWLSLHEVLIVNQFDPKDLPPSVWLDGFGGLWRGPPFMIYPYVYGLLACLFFWYITNVFMNIKPADVKHQLLMALSIGMTAPLMFTVPEYYPWLLD